MLLHQMLLYFLFPVRITDTHPSSSLLIWSQKPMMYSQSSCLLVGWVALSVKYEKTFTFRLEPNLPRRHSLPQHILIQPFIHSFIHKCSHLIDFLFIQSLINNQSVHRLVNLIHPSICSYKLPFISKCIIHSFIHSSSKAVH